MAKQPGPPDVGAQTPNPTYATYSEIVFNLLLIRIIIIRERSFQLVNSAYIIHFTLRRLNAIRFYTGVGFDRDKTSFANDVRTTPA